MEIGDREVRIFENDIIVAGKQYSGRRQLWSLLVYRDLQDSTYSPDVLASYASILKDSNAIYHNNDPSSRKPKSSRAPKYLKIVKQIWEDMRTKQGTGRIKKTSSKVDYKYYDDPNELVDRLRLLYGSARAGNDVHRNEMIEILAELEERGVINKKESKLIYANLRDDGI